MHSIGKVAILTVLGQPVPDDVFQVVTGQVGSMSVEKVVAAVETAAKREGLIAADHYRGEHALYHAVLEALHGVCRGQLELGSILRTAGLKFAVVAGPRDADRPEEGHWLAVALYGYIGAPRRGFEHEVIGLGINHL
ncbi:hut operon transcriptional regulator HutP [Desulfofundulus thermobenzoicus]|uniref:Hut operon positive regulatory protein n=1 Tax=Desulfofundulus thermobenzoicus TaxID=29376 RepID=A0A6N7IQG9_9FIRM|nr:HutP family protein [Desulfofundulus thermobenzoicus]MQL52274.1 hut operon transcriptional regulator HutP [Desulfofundulus thermobenzoicus]